MNEHLNRLPFMFMPRSAFIKYYPLCFSVRFQETDGPPNEIVYLFKDRLGRLESCLEQDLFKKGFAS